MKKSPAKTDVISQVLLQEIRNVADEKDIPVETVRDFLTDSIKKAFAKSTFLENLEVNFSLEDGELSCYRLYEVIDNADELDEYVNIFYKDARLNKSGLNVGDIYKETFDITKEFNQQQVQQILQSFKQKIIEVSNQRIYQSWTPVIGQVIYAEIEKEDKKGNFFTVNLENQQDRITGKNLENTLGFIGKKDQNPLENLDVGKKYHFVVSEVKEQSKYCPVILSRASEKLVEYYMHSEIPEIDDGSISIVKIARIAGMKTKVLVDSKTLPIEPAAICVGPKGARIKTVSALLGKEKIEVYNYNEDPVVLISEVIDRTKISGMKLVEDENGSRHATIVVPEAVLPQVIGKRGSNVRLISLLTEWNINIMTEEEANLTNLDYMRVDSEEYQEHFKALNANKDEANLDILSLNDHDIDELVSNVSLDSLMNEEENNDDEEDLIFETLDENDEVNNELSDAFADEVKNALK
ncbi:transcription termination factor NusA [Ureaplasma ceti]|uniref:Transcription termination/antitermination protein NusA n=1 Tax=Ureaplasma ceti TaxID=3119530 RepID=A0ABP9U639_9BACT